MKDIANFLFEVGMLKKTPRSGFQFLGSGRESVAEHVSRTIFIGYVLCKLEADVDELQLLKMCLFHDLPETRTGDMNYVNKKYVTVDEKKAIKDLTDTLFFGDEMEAIISEFNEKKTKRRAAGPRCRPVVPHPPVERMWRPGKQIQPGVDRLCSKKAVHGYGKEVGRCNPGDRFLGMVV